MSSKKGRNNKGAGKRIGKIIFLCSFCLLLCLFYSLLFRPQKEISIEENRTLQKVPVFTPKSFINGQFQDQMEASIGDQLLFSIQIKYGVKQVFNQLTKVVSGTSKTKEVQVVSTNLTQAEEDNLLPDTQIDQVEETEKAEQVAQAEQIEQPDKNAYTYKEVVADKLYKLDESGYIVEKPHAPQEYEFELYDPEMLKQVSFPKYLYFIESSESADFNDLKKYNAFEYIKQHMPPMTAYDKLTYNSFAEYKTLFYQTDHHWNYHGSYIGYTQIIRMLEGKDVKVLQPLRTHVYDTIYNGSLARDNLLKCSTEKFTVYEYDIPTYKTFVNDEEKEYGYRSLYVSDNDFPHKAYSNHYGMYYGDDWAKVVYDFNCPEKENLLILGTSFTNSVNELIASHYNKTHVLDFRHYKKQYGERINAQKYMEDNNISKMLIIGNISSLGYRINK